MKASSRKQKGKQFENYVANTLHKLLYTINKPYRQYIDQHANVPIILEQIKSNRNKTSGSAFNEIGDIYIPIPILTYMLDTYNTLMFFECKKWRQVDFRHLFQSLNVIVNIVKNDIVATYQWILKAYPNMPNNVKYILAILVFAQHKDSKLYATPVVFGVRNRNQALDNNIIVDHETLLPKQLSHIRYEKDNVQIRIYQFADYISTILSAT